MTPPELISVGHIPLVWHLVAPRLQAAIDKIQFVEIDLPGIFNLLTREEAQLWVGGTGEMIAITRIVNYPNVKRLVVDFIEGKNHKDYFEHMEYIEAWAVSLGATQAEAQIRPGLLKAAKHEGWGRQRIKVFKTLQRGLN